MSPNDIALQSMVQEDAEHKEWQDRGRKLAEEDSSHQASITARNFAIGDWLIQGEGYERVYDDAEAIFTHCTRATLRNRRNVAVSVQSSLRNDNLPWSYYVAVAPLESELQKQYLDLAAEKKIKSVSALRDRIEKENPKPESNKSNDDDAPAATILTLECDGRKGRRELPNRIKDCLLRLGIAWGDEPIGVVVHLMDLAMELSDVIAMNDQDETPCQQGDSREEEEVVAAC
jgi:hypothetical protein